MKFKENKKLKSYAKCDLSRKSLCAKEIDLAQNKVVDKDYINEIFAGLMWLG